MAIQGLIGLGGGATGLACAGAVVYDVDFLVIAGGGSGAGGFGGGGGAGGYRTSYSTDTSGGGASAESAQSVIGGIQYTITVGSGGAVSGQIGQANEGQNSVFADITSGGGGGGGNNDPGSYTTPSGYGSGGGKSRYAGEGAAGTPGQGYPGGDNTEVSEDRTGAGGGGAGSAGQSDYPCPAPSGGCAGNGGNGQTSTITGGGVTRAGGGGGGTRNFNLWDGAGTGGPGGGGNGADPDGGDPGGNGTTNSGSGAGAGIYHSTKGYYPSGVGGSGIVIIRMETKNYSGTTTGSPSVTTSGDDTILTYTQSGTYTA